jgi:Family of unknown function (DUF6114)/zinc-ribbon domain
MAPPSTPMGAPWYPYAGAMPQASAEPPTLAMVLSLAGGVFIFMGGLLEFGLGSASATLAMGGAGWFIAVLGMTGMALGVLTVLLGILLYVSTHLHTVAGALIIVFACASLITSFGGGFFLGFILALIGGILGVAWRPFQSVIVYQVPNPVQRICPKCGRVIDPNVQFCPFCGNSLTPPAPPFGTTAPPPPP